MIVNRMKIQTLSSLLLLSVLLHLSHASNTGSSYKHGSQYLPAFTGTCKSIIGINGVRLNHGKRPNSFLALKPRPPTDEPPEVKPHPPSTPPPVELLSKNAKTTEIAEGVKESLFGPEIERNVPSSKIKGAVLSTTLLALYSGASVAAATSAGLAAAYVAITPGTGGEALRKIGEISWSASQLAIDLYKKFEVQKTMGKATQIFVASMLDSMDVGDGNMRAKILEENSKIREEEIAKVVKQAEEATQLVDEILKEEEKEAAKLAERERIAEEERAAELAEQERIAEEERIAAELAEEERFAEEERIAAELAEQERLAEEERIAAELAEQERLAEEERIAAELAEQERLAEEERIAAELAEQERLAEEVIQAVELAEKENEISAETALAARLAVEAAQAVGINGDATNNDDDEYLEDDNDELDDYLSEEDWEASIRLAGKLEETDDSNIAEEEIEDKMQWEAATLLAQTLASDVEEEQTTSEAVPEVLPQDDIAKAARMAVELTSSDADEVESTIDDDAGIIDYEKKTVVELKDILRSRKLKVSGRKAELIQRLREYDNE